MKFKRNSKAWPARTTRETLSKQAKRSRPNKDMMNQIKRSSNSRRKEDSHQKITDDLIVMIIQIIIQMLHNRFKEIIIINIYYNSQLFW